MAGLYIWQAHAVYLAIEVEGIYIGHSGNVIQDGHDAVIECGCQDVILCADTVDEQL